MNNFKIEKTLEERRIKDIKKNIKSYKIDNVFNYVIPTISGVGTLMCVNSYIDSNNPSTIVATTFFGAITVFSSFFAYRSNKKNNQKIKKYEKTLQKLK